MTAQLGRVLRTRTAMASWVGLWVVAGVVLVVAWSMRAGEARPATTVTRTDEAPVAASIRFVRMTVAETVVEVTVTGRPEFARLADPGVATLTDARGAQHFARTENIDGRTATISFPGLADVAPGPARIEIPRAGLTNAPIDAPAEEGQVTYVAVEPVVVVLTPTGGTIERLEPGTSATVEAGYGATVTSVVRDDEGAVISGRFDGFTREEIQSLSLGGTRLVLADGTTASLSGGGYGLGDGLTEFRLNFRVPREVILARLELHVDARVPPIVRTEANAETGARLDRFEPRGPFVLTLELER